jgi:hypothetical protein
MSLVVGTTTDNAVINSTAIVVGNTTTNVNINQTSLRVGNSSVNVIAVNTSTISSMNDLLSANAFGIRVGGADSNIVISTSGSIFVGNSTTSVTANTVALKIGNSSVNAIAANTTTAMLVGGAFNVNTTSHSIGNTTANASLSTTGLFVGNATANIITVNSSAVTAIGGSIIANTTQISIGSGISNSYISATGLGVNSVLVVNSSVLEANSNIRAKSGLIVTNTTALEEIIERANIQASAPVASQPFEVLNKAVVYYTNDATTNWALNVRGDSTTTFNSITAVGDSVSIVLMVTNGTTPYMQTSLSIDGTAQTVKWQGGTAPTVGTGSAVDIYTFTIIKTSASPTYTVLGTLAYFL